MYPLYVSEMKSEIKHAEMLTSTVMKVFNSEKEPFALFKTKVLIMFHLQEESLLFSLSIFLSPLFDSSFFFS